MKQINPLEAMKAELLKKAFGPEAPLDKELGICIKCKRPGLARCYSAAGREELRISGICERCFDEMFK